MPQMDKRTVAELIYWNAVPIAIGAVGFYYLNKIENPWDYIKAAIPFLGALIPFMIVHFWIGNKIFPEKLTLANKIMRCKLRVKYGSSYCAKCPDGYTCASDIEGGKGKVKEGNVEKL